MYNFNIYGCLKWLEKPLWLINIKLYFSMYNKYSCTREYDAQMRIVCSNESDHSLFFTWPVLAHQISNFLRLNYKFSLPICAEAPNKKLTCIHKEIAQLLVVLVNRWRKCSVSQKVRFIWLRYNVVSMIVML